MKFTKVALIFMVLIVSQDFYVHSYPTEGHESGIKKWYQKVKTSVGNFFSKKSSDEARFEEYRQKFENEVVPDMNNKIGSCVSMIREQITIIAQGVKNATDSVRACLNENEGRIKQIHNVALKDVVRCGKGRVDNALETVEDNIIKTNSSDFVDLTWKETFKTCSDSPTGFQCIGSFIFKVIDTIVTVAKRAYGKYVTGETVLDTLEKDLVVCASDQVIQIVIDGARILKDVARCTGHKMAGRTEFIVPKAGENVVDIETLEL